MAGAFAGAKLATFLSGTTQLAILAIVILVAAASMLRRGGADVDATASPRRVLLLPAGIGVGILTGVVGIGGGFLVVPALVLLARVPMRQAVGTSLLVIAMNSASDSPATRTTWRSIWGFLSAFTAVAVGGAIAGSALASRVPQAALKRGFAVFLLAVGGFVLYRSRAALHLATSHRTHATAVQLVPSAHEVATAVR